MVSRFSFCVVLLIPWWVSAQNNDNCADALLLEVGAVCSMADFTTIGATSEDTSIAGDPSCGSFSGADVWFMLTLPTNGALRIEVNSKQGATPPSFIVYQGTCGNFTEVGCVRNDPGKTFFRPDLSGETLYIRVYRYFNASGNDFSICVSAPVLPDNDQCEQAREISVSPGCTPLTVSGIFATSQTSATAPEPSCGYYKGGDIWFKTTMPASGLLRINKTRVTGATNPSLAIYTGTCGTLTQVFCSPNDATETFNSPDLAGEPLLLRLFAYNSEEGATFTLCLYEEEAPVNDNCGQALFISTSEACDPVQYQSVLATSEAASVASGPSCGGFVDADVWFRTVVPASGKLRIETTNLMNGNPPSVVWYQGSCGDFVELACMRQTEQETFSWPELAGDTLYLRIFPFNSEDGIPFLLCLYEPPNARVVGVKESFPESVTTYPNPVRDIIYLEIPADDRSTLITLTDALGRLAGRYILPSGQPGQLDVSFLLPGTYFLGIAHGSDLHTSRIIKE